jgi:pyroglutamyl-peptidase
MTRILISGFGPFPGAPSNPTMAIVRHLMRSRHPRFKGVELLMRELPTDWDILNGFKQTIKNCKPDAVLMFGLSGRRLTVSPETRAINRALLLRSDADGRKPKQPQLKKGASAFMRSSIDAVRMTAAMVQSGIHARVSHNAGEYLCNALLWTALETGVPAIFVHVPLPTRSRKPRAMTISKRPNASVLAKAGEVALSCVVKELKKR